MQKSYPDIHFSCCIKWYVLIICISGPALSAQGQNPFDIKSRKLIDSTEQPQIDVPSVSTVRNNRTSPLNHNSVNDTLIHEDNSAPATEGTDTSLIHPLIPDTIPVKSSPPAKPGSSPVSQKIKQETTPPLPGIETLTDEVTLSGQADQTLSWWYYVFDVILLLVLLGAFISDKNIFSPLRKAFVHENFLRFLYRDTYLRKPGLFIYLNILFLLSFGFIMFRTAQYFSWASKFNDYLIIQGVVLFLFLIKHVSLHFLSQIVDKPFDLRFYQYWMILSAGLIGLWMIPLALMVSVLPHRYLTIALIIISIPVVILLVYRQIKAMIHAKFFLSKHFFQIFLYFCAVEIVPAVLLVDILVHY